MQRFGDAIVYAATDLVGYAFCPRLAELELAAALGRLERPAREDPELDRIAKRGLQHERAVLAELEAKGVQVRRIELDETPSEEALRRAAEATAGAMREGAEVIYQATFYDGRRRGHADFLVRVDRESALGAWAYEPADAKLARSVKAGALVQLCFYGELLKDVQGVEPEYVSLRLGSGREERFRFAEYAPAVRLLMRRLEKLIDEQTVSETLPHPAPEPVEHCEVCRWRLECERARREEDHLSLVAGITGRQRRELRERCVATRRALAQADPETLRGGRIARDTLERLIAQAALQVRGEDEGKMLHELLPLERAEDGSLLPRGLLTLPPPSPADLFLDLEGDPFALDEGVEYLFGIAEVAPDESGRPTYRHWWSIADGEVTHAAERRAFEQLMDFITGRWREHPELHIYHFGVYEPAALKRLASRYGTRASELDELLRKNRFVDLHRVVRQSLIASVESYSLKQLEPLYGYEREAELRDASSSIVEFETWLELGEGEARNQLLEQIRQYNRDDCESLIHLRNWLEERRQELEKQHGPLPRLRPEASKASAELTAEEEEVRHLQESLLEGVPEAEEERTPAQRARWLLAHLLEWHRREDKAVWWEYYSVREMDEEERLQEPRVIAGLRQAGTANRFSFPPQDFRIRDGSRVVDPDAESRSPVEVTSLDMRELILELKRAPKRAPQALFEWQYFNSKPIRERLRAVARTWIEARPSLPPHVRQILERTPPSFAQNGSVLLPGESAREAALRVLDQLGGTYLAIQGPPGSGKSTLGSELIERLVASGKRVGVVAVSHRVITNLLKKVHERGVDPDCIFQKAGKKDVGEEVPWRVEDRAREATSFIAEQAPCVVGGTVWLWVRDDHDEPLDVLVIDEAGQISLANAVAAMTSARSVILLGDPNQLDQPLRASHPPGTDRSVLAHLLGDAETMPPELGLFLERTHRLHPEICHYTSSQFYAGRLQPAEACGQRRLEGVDPLPGAGLAVCWVEHEDCDVESPEEADVISRIVDRLLRAGRLVAEEGVRELTPEDVLVVAPYNVQVNRLARELPADVRVGTVDRFQGQEAPVVICSMTASSIEDAPRGMDFLFDRHRLNVATSRAQVLAILVASPRLLSGPWRTPRQLRLASGFAAFVERACEVRPSLT